MLLTGFVSTENNQSIAFIDDDMGSDVPMVLTKLGILGSFFLVQMKLSGYLPVYLPLYLYPLIVAIGMASYLGINFLQLRRINQIPLAAALKNHE
ncbi:hypothetical protein [Acetobacterium malicum]|uniref:hypothetical protein n=1 Tax=Acetobacterium malicum TaxID=52692 RepID=UPI00041536D7|nr:hypothetical protein [Acetobacterium dehalogenans]